ncbi:hypothetical protein GCK32_006158 [Trichostrongylus colubriformis]|uniref:Uncharacterized protein n=1 Tax=Trichostrongylus colubriformis TaxID=6319 RepID=A0AAN8F5X2_TRICO
MPTKRHEEVCMRLVEYPKNGRMFRKWTYERIGEKVEPIRVHVPDCNYLKACHMYDENEDSATPLAHRLKQQRVEREEALSVEGDAEAISMEEGGDTSEELMKHEKEEFEKRFDLFDKRTADSYNDLTYQKNKTEIKTRRRHAGRDAWTSCKEMVDKRSVSKDLKNRNAECDGTRLQRLIKEDPTAAVALHDVIKAMEKVLHNYNERN